MSSKNLERWFPRLQGPIDSIFQQWGTLASQRVSERLGRAVEFTVKSASIASEESGSALESDCECRLKVDGIEDPWSLRIDMPSIYRMIDGLLGSSASEPDGVGGPLRQIDWRVAKLVFGDLVTPCTRLWFGDVSVDRDRAVEISRAKLFSEPRVLATASARVRVDFQVRMSGLGAVGEKNIGQVDGQFDGQYVGQGAWWIPESLLVDQLGRLLFQGMLAADLSVVLAKSRISCAELAELEVGDIISTEQMASSLVDIESLGGLLYRAAPGVFRGRRAVRLVGVQPERSQVA